MSTTWSGAAQPRYELTEFGRIVAHIADFLEDVSRNRDPEGWQDRAFDLYVRLSQELG